MHSANRAVKIVIYQLYSFLCDFFQQLHLSIEPVLIYD